MARSLSLAPAAEPRFAPGAASSISPRPQPRLARFRSLQPCAASQKFNIPGLRRSPKPVEREPQGTPQDRTAFWLAFAALTPPTAAGFLSTNFVLQQCFGFPAQEAALDSFEAVQHLSGIYTNEGFCVLALVVLYCLAEYGAKEGELDDDGLQVLSVAVVIFAASNTLGLLGATLAPSLNFTAAPTPTALADAAAVLFAGLSIYSAGGSVSKYGTGSALKTIVKNFKDMAALRDNQNGALELYYKISFWSTIIVGGSFAFSPESPLAAVNDPTASGQILTHCFGLGAIFMLAPVQYVLARGARNGTLGLARNKLLNLGVVAAIVLINGITIYGGEIIAGLEAASNVTDLNVAQGVLTEFDIVDYNPIFNYFGALSVASGILGVYLYQGLFAKPVEQQ